MTKEKAIIQHHSEEVNDLMGHIPSSIIRWGLSVIFLILLTVIVGSYFFKFKEVVSSPIIITTGNPPAPLVSKAAGRISKLYIADGGKVNSGDPVALINNPANVHDIHRLEEILQLLDTVQIINMLETIVLPEKFVLGAMHETWNNFYSNWQGYKEYLNQNFLPNRILLLELEIKKQEQYFDLLLEQIKMYKEEITLAEKDLERHNRIQEKGGISESQLDAARNKLIHAQKNFLAYKASLKSTEINLISHQSTLLEMQEQYRQQNNQYELNIADNVRSLKNQLKNWKDTYMLTSPIDGVVTLTKFWSENHVVSIGERVATVVPEVSRTVLCRASINSNGIGKVEVGQKVNIKLHGYPYMEHGTLTGFVKAISLVPEQKLYLVEISVNDELLSTYREHFRLVQEMEGTADIITHETRLITKFLTPLKMLK